MNVHPDTATPTLSVIDPRSLVLRSVGYCQHPDQPGIDPRINRQVFDAAGRQVESWDPRLWGTAPKPNLATVYGLSGQAVLTDSVDAGWQLSLPDQSGLTCSFWDARGSQRHTEFDEQKRPVALTEQAFGEQPHVVERFTYAGISDTFAQSNQCGRLIRHDDPAGSRLINDYGLAGAELIEARRFLTSLDQPDWPTAPDVRDQYLEEKSYVTSRAFYPTGELQRQTDAMNNSQTFHYNVAGKLFATWLLRAGETKQPKCLVSDIRYNAQEQIERETAGNGVITRAEYSLEDGRLLRLIAGVGEQNPLQNLHYAYDPVGNIVSLEDKAQAVTYFNHQRIEPISLYRYDSLDQLVEAKGWEVSQPSHGPALPELIPAPLDPRQRRNYTQKFSYDRAGNLITRQHSDAPGFAMFTSAHSNRSLAQRDEGSLPGEPQIPLGFDAAGNQLELQRGLSMHWDIRNQLSRVTLVKREGEADDYECYAYDRLGHRLRKAFFSQTNRRTLHAEVRYLPGLEIHRQAGGEVRHVISVEAGRCSIRVLRWPEGEHVDQQRYCLSDHLGSSTLELDDEAGVLTQEHYYPFGGTACWAGRNALVANHKTIRYSGKERDVTGLYYYGYRYYAPWLQRWMSADPAGPVNGLNIFIFVSNDPINLKDTDGRIYEGKNDRFERDPGSGNILARGLDEFQPEQQLKITTAFSEVEHIYASAEAAMGSDLVDHARILYSFFGSEYEAVRGQVLEAFARGQKWARKYQEPWGRDRIVGVDSVQWMAVVNPADSRGRIFININHLDANTLSGVVGHEVTHLKKVEGVLGSGTKDYFYLPLRSRRIASELAMRGELTDWIVKTLEDVGGTNDFVRGVEKYGGRSVYTLDVDTAASVFNQSPRIRTQMASENADSIMAAATELSHRFADSLEFRKILYG